MNAIQKATTATVQTSKILTALHEVMSACGYVQKQGENKFHGYKYAGEANLLEVLRPAMVKAGLLLIPSHRSRTEIDQFGNICVEVEYTLAHKDGEVWPEKIVAFGMGNDKNKQGGVGDKGLYKAATGANKYLLFKLFQIETGDDPEKDSEHEKAPANEPKQERVWRGPMNKTNLKQAMRELWREMEGCTDQSELDGVLENYKKGLDQCRIDLPEIWDGDGGDVEGIRKKIARLEAQFQQEKAA